MSAVTYVTRLGILSLWVAALFDPAASVFNLKYIGLSLFGFALLLNISTDRIRISATDPILIFFVFFLFLQFYGLFTGAVRGGFSEKFIDTSYIFSAIYFSFVFLLIDVNNFAYSTTILLKFCAVIGALIVAAYVFISLDLAQWNSFFLGNGLAYISERSYGGVTFPYIYFIVSPILVFAISKNTNDVMNKFSIWRIVKLLFFVASLSLTGTRVNIAFSFISIVLTVFWFQFGRAAYLYIFAGSVIAFGALMFANIEIVNAFFDASEANNNTKLGYLPYYWKELNSVSTFFFGQGFNAHSWSSELREFLAPEASKLELTYLEVFRIFGVPLGALFIVSVLWYLFSTDPGRFDSRNWIQPAAMSYIFMAALNPYLFSLDGMMVLATAFAYKYHSHRMKVLITDIPGWPARAESDFKRNPSQ